MRLLRRSFAYATVGAGIAGLTGVFIYGPEEVERQIKSSGLVRVGRAARVVRNVYNFQTVMCPVPKSLNLSRFNPNCFNIRNENLFRGSTTPVIPRAFHVPCPGVELSI